MSHLNHIRQLGAAYRQKHPVYLQGDDIPMIDLQRRLPTLKDSLSPVESEASFLVEDILTALALLVFIIAIAYLFFGIELS